MPSRLPLLHFLEVETPELLVLDFILALREGTLGEAEITDPYHG